LEQQLSATIPTIFTRGLLVLGITILVVELFVYLSSKKITRQKFIG